MQNAISVGGNPFSRFPYLPIMLLFFGPFVLEPDLSNPSSLEYKGEYAPQRILKTGDSPAPLTVAFSALQVSQLGATSVEQSELRVHSAPAPQSVSESP